MVLVYDDLDWDAAVPPHQRLVRALLDRLEARGIPGRRRALRHAERYWSYLCYRPPVLPAAGPAGRGRARAARSRRPT